ncbi:DUF1064 domain-containing protein [Petroclostridium sp. X23]|uniref:DUF1064 domain-containing protein n=1 Tax=Petroclostridium sp. X23 TaxID=3045146 RepID=UPI0024ADD6EB|nr:DUF1064 domain-containing protein [Petroclostridium sp. X23]WHH59130.1 DUF1064 domain-containing protein [Petroclostridium sp. X23]
MSLRWSEDDFKDYLKRTGKQQDQKPKNKSKYNAKRVRVDGILFHSQKEAAYYAGLKLLLKVGEIKGFCLQPKFVLVEGDEQDQAITYSADFIVFHNDSTAEIVDTKGFESEQWKRTFKQFRLKYPGLELKVQM